MATDEALDFKDKGNQALKAQSYDEAVFFYTKAVELDATNHVYRANRAVAHLKAKDYGKALDDASEAIRLNPAYFKAFNTKGAALEHLGRWEEAVATYTAGLDKSPDNDTLKANLERVQARLSGTGGGAASGAGAAASASASGGGDAASSGSLAKPTMMETALFGLRVFVLLNAVGYLLPLGSMSFDCHRRAMFGSMAALAVSAFTIAGRPRCSQEYAAKLVGNPAMHYFFMSLLFLTARPFAISLFPIVAAEVMDAHGQTHSTLIHIAAYVLRTSPATAEKASGVLDKWLPRLLADPEFVTRASTAKWTAVNRKLLEWIAYVEVLIGIMVVIELLTPWRNFLLLIMFWQTLQIRYMTSAFSRGAFAQMHAKIMSLTTHRFCPRLIGTGYNKLSGWLHGMAQPPQAGDASAGRPRCSIM